MSLGNAFPNQNCSYKDTKGAGGISVRGFYIETDQEGFIEGPKELAKEIAPHGFLPQDRPSAVSKAASAKR